MEEKKLNNEVVAENAITDDTEIDVGMIEKSILFDKELHKEQHVWLLKGSIWKTYSFSKILDLIRSLQGEVEGLTSVNKVLNRENDELIEKIEWLTEEKRFMIEKVKSQPISKLKKDEILWAYQMDCGMYQARESELQKQVDELTAENSRLNKCVMSEEQVRKCCEDIIQDTMNKAVKDTAKEIYNELKTEVISVDIPCGAEPAEEDCEAVLWWKIEKILRKKAQVE